MMVGECIPLPFRQLMDMGRRQDDVRGLTWTHGPKMVMSLKLHLNCPIVRAPGHSTQDFAPWKHSMAVAPFALTFSI